MAFKITHSEHFYYPVKLVYLRDDGSRATHQLTVQFKRFDVDGLRDRQLKDGAQLYKDLLVQYDGDRDLTNEALSVELIKQGKADLGSEEMADDLMEIMTGWKDVTDEAGPIDFTRDNVLRLIKFTPNAYAAIKAAFNEAHSPEGLAETRRKNS